MYNVFRKTTPWKIKYSITMRRLEGTYTWFHRTQVFLFFSFFFSCFLAVSSHFRFFSCVDVCFFREREKSDRETEG